MPNFSYIARDLGGQKVQGKLSGPSSHSVVAELQSRQLAPVTVHEVQEQRAISLWSGGAGRRVSVRQLASAYRQLADLLHAGVPLLRALRLLGRGKANARLAKIMNEVADAVAEGSRLGDAMAAHAEVFPLVQVAMIRAGERGSFLESVLNRMATFLELQAEMRSKLIGNMIYPFVLLALGTGIVITAMTVFVPRFRGFYTRIELPWPTKVLLGVSDAFSAYWVLMLVALAAIAFGLWRLWRMPAARRQMLQWQMRVPQLGPLMRSVAVARFTRMLGTLLENGIPMLQAMQISREAAGNVLLAEAIDAAAEAVRSGEALAQPLAASGLFSEDVIEMISVGESANNLPQVLITIADTIERRIDRLLNVFLRLVEPALLLLLASAVLFIFVALIVPMMRMSSSMSG